MVKEVDVQRMIEAHEDISRNMVDAGVSTGLSEVHKSFDGYYEFLIATNCLLILKLRR